MYIRKKFGIANPSLFFSSRILKPTIPSRSVRQLQCLEGGLFGCQLVGSQEEGACESSQQRQEIVQRVSDRPPQGEGPRDLQDRSKAQAGPGLSRYGAEQVWVSGRQKRTHMPRVAGIDIPEKKKIFFALQYVHGVGPRVAKLILEEAGVDPEQRATEVDEAKLAQINTIIDNNYLVEGALRRQVGQNVQRLKEIRSYRGERHRKGLPVRGQRTRTNARTRKGRRKTVAGKKGVKG